MSYSIQRAVSDGTLSSLALSIQFYNRADISVYLGNVLWPVNTVWSWVGATGSTIKFKDPVPSDIEVMVKRVTDVSDIRHNFSQGAQFTSTTLDDNFKQMLFVAQEAQEGGRTITDVFGDIDMHGFKVRNMGAATELSGAAQLAQAGGGSTGNTPGITYQPLTGDGVAMAFPLTSSSLSMFVFVSGVYQQSAGWSLIGPNLVFSEAPPKGVAIEVLSLGTVGSSAKVTSFEPSASIPDTNVQDAIVRINAVAADSVIKVAALTKGLKGLYLLDAYLPDVDFLKTDVSDAVQAALTMVASRGGGAVHMGPHAYYMKGVTIPNSVYVMGHPGVTTIVNDSTSVPTWRVGTYCGLTGVRAYYPYQTTTGSPVPHAPFITHSETDVAAYITLDQIDLYNAYDGIVLGNSTHGCGPLWISRIIGFPLHTGLALDNCTDCPYVNDVHFNPNTNPTLSTATRKEVYSGAVAYKFGRVDGLAATGIFAFGYSIGLSLSGGLPSGSANMIRVTNFGFDICRSPIDIQSHQDGVFLTNGFATTGSAIYGVTGGVCRFGGGQTALQGKITATSVSFRNFAASALLVDSSTDLSMCTFTDYNNLAGSYPAVEVSGPNVRLNVTGGGMDGGGRAGSTGIRCEGMAGYDITVQGVRFERMTANDMRVFGAGNLTVANNTDSAGSMWNFVPFAHAGGRMATYQAPTAFPSVDPAAFPVGTRWEHQQPTVGQPTAWVRTLAVAIKALANL